MVDLSSSTTRRNLRSLLDNVASSAQRDVHDFTGGHLNESNLYKPPEKRHQAWKTSEREAMKRPARPSALVPMKPAASTSTRREKMKDTLVNFTLGTAGNFPLPPVKDRAPSMSTKFKSSPPKSRSSGNSALPSPQTTPPLKGLDKGLGLPQKSSGDAIEYIDDHVFVEELNIPEVLNSRVHELDFQSKRSSPRSSLSYTFTSGHIGAITKKDQYERHKKIERDIVGKQDVSRRNIMHGIGAVENLEKKLWEQINKSDPEATEPDFKRLQLHSSIFEDIIDKSQTFGFILRTIKREYDDYIASLLDPPIGEHRILYDQASKLASHPSANPELLEVEQQRVSEEEELAWDLLDENERLRKALRDEMDRPVEPEPDIPATTTTKQGTATQDIATTVEDFRGRILEKLDGLKSMRETLRKDYVPATVCTHLEQCIKETEMESQRIKSNESYFESDINNMEKDLQETIESADTTERDQRRIWKKITTAKADEANSEDEEQDESSKWEWYIS